MVGFGGKLSALFKELRRRKVIRVAVVYIFGTWLTYSDEHDIVRDYKISQTKF